MTIDGEGHLAAPARDEKHVRTPPLIRGRLLHLAEMGPPMPTMDPWREHEPMQLHHASDALPVVARAEGPIRWTCVHLNSAEKTRRPFRGTFAMWPPAACYVP